MSNGADARVAHSRNAGPESGVTRFSYDFRVRSGERDNDDDKDNDHWEDND